MFVNTVKPVLSGHSKIDKTKILMTNGSFMKVGSIAECSHWGIHTQLPLEHSAILLICINLPLRDNQSCLLFAWRLKTGFTVVLTFLIAAYPVCICCWSVWHSLFCFDSLRSSQQFFCHVRMGLPGLNQY